MLKDIVEVAEERRDRQTFIYCKNSGGFEDTSSKALPRTETLRNVGHAHLEIEGFPHFPDFVLMVF